MDNNLNSAENQRILALLRKTKWSYEKVIKQLEQGTKTYKKAQIISMTDIVCLHSESTHLLTELVQTYSEKYLRELAQWVTWDRYTIHAVERIPNQELRAED